MTHQPARGSRATPHYQLLTPATRSARTRPLQFSLKRWRAYTAAAALLASAAVVGLGAAAPAAATPAAFNPLADYAQWNVVAFGDTDIHAESEGAIATGGDLSFTGTNAAFKSAAPVALLVGGRIAFEKSSGTLQVNSPGSIKIGNLKGTDVLDTDQNNAQVNTQVVAAGSGYGSTPSVTLNHRQAAATVSAPGLFDATFSQTRASATSAQVADAATATCNASRVITPTVTGSSATVVVGSGTNYWNVSSDQLSAIREITFAGSLTPDPNHPLIVNVSGSGSVTLNLTMAGARDPHGILFNMPGVTSIVQSGDSIDGSILAPHASYTKNSANVQGTVVVASAQLDGSEEHYFPFGGLVAGCDAAVTTPTPTPTTPATTTPTGTPTQTPTQMPTQMPTTPTSSGTPAAVVGPTGGTSAGTAGSAPVSDQTQLAHTGSDLTLGASVGAVLLVIGAAIGAATWWTRRRRATE